jgi:hypothetical protein
MERTCKIRMMISQKYIDSGFFSCYFKDQIKDTLMTKAAKLRRKYGMYSLDGYAYFKNDHNINKLEFEIRVGTNIKDDVIHEEFIQLIRLDEEFSMIDIIEVINIS